jgi:hypothetical protein
MVKTLLLINFADQAVIGLAAVFPIMLTST